MNALVAELWQNFRKPRLHHRGGMASVRAPLEIDGHSFVIAFNTHPQSVGFVGAHSTGLWATMVSTAAASDTSVPASTGARDTREVRLAEAAARGLSGAGIDDQQMLRRLIRARDADQVASAAARESSITPAAASLLAQLRAEVGATESS